MRNFVISFLLTLTLFGCAGGQNHRRPSDTPVVETADIIATIDSIDYEKRTGILKLPDGSKRSFNALPEAEVSDQLKVGQQVILRGAGRH
jgi:hypothetical protein